MHIIYLLYWVSHEDDNNGNNKQLTLSEVYSLPSSVLYLFKLI